MGGRLLPYAGPVLRAARERAARESHRMFRRTPVVTLRTSIETFPLKLWDTESESLVPFPGRRAPSRPVAPGFALQARYAQGERGGR